MAISGRPGPVWIEVPLDLQLIKLKNKRFKNKIKKIDLEKNIKEEKKIKSVTSMIYNSKRPLVVAGNGIVTSDTSLLFKKFIKKYNLPFVCTWINLSLYDKKNYCGN